MHKQSVIKNHRTQEDGSLFSFNTCIPYLNQGLLSWQMMNEGFKIFWTACPVVQTCSTCQMLHDVTEPLCWSLAAGRDAICLSHVLTQNPSFPKTAFRNLPVASNVLVFYSLELRRTSCISRSTPISIHSPLCLKCYKYSCSYLCQGLSLRSQIST